MPYSFPIVVLATLFASSAASAQPQDFAERKVSPNAFLGVDPSGDFINDVPECVPEVIQHSEPCRVATAQPDHFEVRGLPYLPISPGYKLFVTVNEGTVRQLELTGNATNLYLVKEMLTDQLGQPSESGSKWVKLSSGASYEAEAFKWNIRGMTVDFSRDVHDLSRYSVTFSTMILGTQSKQRDEELNADSTANPKG